MLARRTTILLSILLGVSLEVLITAASGRREAWDSRLYWIAGVPVAMLASLAIGFLARAGDWVWTVLVVPAQLTAMAVRSRDLSLLPLGIVLGAILSLPFLTAAFVGQKLRR